MILVYNLRDIGDIYDRFGGVAGSAYLVGGVGITFLGNGRHHHGTNPVGYRPAPRCQRWLPQVQPAADLEPILSRSTHRT